MMVVPDEQVAALRSFLASEVEELLPRHWQLLQSDQLEGYEKFIYTAFVTAARNRFSPTYTRADIIGFVAEFRAALPERPDFIDPLAAENVIRRALGDPVTDDRSSMTKARAQAAVLYMLTLDQELDDAGLDDFLDTALTLANQWWADEH